MVFQHFEKTMRVPRLDVDQFLYLEQCFEFLRLDFCLLSLCKIFVFYEILDDNPPSQEDNTSEEDLNTSNSRSKLF